MIEILNVITLLYLITLFNKKYPVSLSMYWLLVFYAIYVLVPSIKEHSSMLYWIPDELINKASGYAIIGICSFILSNHLFLFKLKKIRNLDINKVAILSHDKVKKLLVFVICIAVILFLISFGPSGVFRLLSGGSRQFWLGQTNKNIISVFAELSVFYIGILLSVLYLTAPNKKKRRATLIVMFFLLVILSIITFARRYIVYPVMAIVFYKLSISKKKKKVLLFGIVFLPVFFLMMYLMGYFRTFGVHDATVSDIILHLNSGNLTDIFLSNTDFAASYRFFIAQIQMEDIFIGPAGYFKILFTLIPRSLWPAKPEYSSVAILSILEPDKVNQGFSAATGYLGEAHASLGILGIVLISLLWGGVCGFLDQRYHALLSKKTDISRDSGTVKFSIFEYYYLYTGVLLISECHRGDFGAASLHFVLEVVLIGLLLKMFGKATDKSKLMMKYKN